MRGFSATEAPQGIDEGPGAGSPTHLGLQEPQVNNSLGQGAGGMLHASVLLLRPFQYVVGALRREEGGKRVHARGIARAKSTHAHRKRAGAVADARGLPR